MKENEIIMRLKYSIKIINKKKTTKIIFLFFLLSLINFLLYNYIIRKIKLNNNSNDLLRDNKTNPLNKQIY